MKFEIYDDPTQLQRVRINYAGDHLDWQVNTYQRTTLKNPAGLFLNINKWLSRLPKEKLDRMWFALRDTNSLLNDNTEFETAIDTTMSHVKELYAAFELKRFMDWVHIHGEMHTPPLKLEYGASDTQELTYLRQDYLELMSLAEALRLMIPIWGQFIKNYYQITGSQYKEHNALMLIGLSEVVESAPYKRLETYVDANIRNGEIDIAAIDGLLGSADALEFMMAQAVVRKVAVGETTTSDVDLIRNVSNYIRNLWTQLSKRFSTGGNRLVEKMAPQDSDKPDNTSCMENQRPKEGIPSSELDSAIYLLTHPTTIARRAYPDISKELVKACVEFCEISQPSLTVARQQLAAIILDKSILSTLILEMCITDQYRVLGIALAVYIAREDYHVAALLTCDLEEADSTLFNIGGVNKTVDKEHYALLDKLYYSDTAGEVTRPAKRTNPGYIAVKEILTSFDPYELIVNLPEEISETESCPFQNGDVLGEGNYANQICKALYDLHHM